MQLSTEGHSTDFQTGSLGLEWLDRLALGMVGLSRAQASEGLIKC